MKDYFRNGKEASTFIRKYTVEFGTIIVELGNGKTTEIPYSYRNETEILEKMKLQIINSDKYKDKINKKINSIISTSLPIKILIIGAGTKLISFVGHYSMPYYLLMSAITSSTLLTLIDATVLIKCKKRLMELEKSEFFLDNIELFKNSYNIDLQMLECSKETKKKIQDISKKNEVITINNMDNLSLDELKLIKEYLIDHTETKSEYKNDYYKILTLIRK